MGGRKSRREIKTLSDLNKIYKKSFIDILIANFHLKLYDFDGSKEQVERKKTFKSEFIQEYKDRVADAEEEKRKRK